MITQLVLATSTPAGVLPAPPPEAPPELVEFVDLWFELGQWFIGVLAALCVLVCAVLLIVGRKQRSATAYQGLEGIAWIIGGVGLAAFGPVLVLAFR